MTDKTMTLEPCPFCGPGNSVVELGFDDVAHRWRVYCGRCGCSTGIHPRDKTEAPAIAAWNTRHLSQPAERTTGLSFKEHVAIEVGADESDEDDIIKHVAAWVAAAKTAERVEAAALPMATAPRDGRMLRLLVKFTDHATEDAEEAWTIGSHVYDDRDDDLWAFAGWCWTHDHFTEGKGEPIGWLPFHTATPPAAGAPDARIIDLAERLVAAGPKAAYVSASECHEISEFILSLAAAPSPEAKPHG